MVYRETRAFELAIFTAVFGFILFIIWASFWLFWLFLAIKTRSPVKIRRSVLFPFLPFLVIAIWIVITSLFPGLIFVQVVPEDLFIGAAGIAITLAGLGFAIWARLHLGTNWSGAPVIRVHHTLIRTGPYRFVRHPIYTGILFAFVGTALVIGAFWAFLAIVILLIAFMGKILQEEKVLVEEFGESYIQYKKEVKSIIPFIF
jgi:protein-S-isoprenylcysteine O-methyltransferase Ste14